MTSTTETKHTCRYGGHMWHFNGCEACQATYYKQMAIGYTNGTPYKQDALLVTSWTGWMRIRFLVERFRQQSGQEL